MATAENRTLYHPLTRRPQAATVTVRELIQKVQAGEVRIPHFQRPLRWNARDVRELFDSIWRGYPVGSLLFWKRPASVDRVQIGGASLEAPSVGDAWWVVDGQQRTTALAASLLDLDHAGDARWTVRFSPETGEFLSGEASPERMGREVPLSVLGDLRRLGRWLRDSADLDEECVDRVEDAQQRILDYAIPAYIVETDEERALRAVFARLNSTGARMRADEVFQALFGASGAGEESLDLDYLQAECDIDGFGQPPRSEVLKAVLAMSGIDPSRTLEDLGDQLSDLVPRSAAVEALSLTVRFLIDDCGIPHVSLIPYPVVFFILARWFHVHGRPQHATRELLARWVWRGAVTGVHQRAEVSKMREQVRDIVEGDEFGSLDRLLSRVAGQPTGSWALGPFNLKSAKSRIESLALLSRQPRDRYAQVSLSALLSSGRIAREIFAAKDWKQLQKSDRAIAKSAANRALLDTQHTGLVTEMQSWDANRQKAELESHLISCDAFSAMIQRDIVTFLHLRADAVTKAVQQFTNAKAAWDQPDVKPTQAYLEFDDE